MNSRAFRRQPVGRCRACLRSRFSMFARSSLCSDLSLAAQRQQNRSDRSWMRSFDLLIHSLCAFFSSVSAAFSSHPSLRCSLRRTRSPLFLLQSDNSSPSAHYLCVFIESVPPSHLMFVPVEQQQALFASFNGLTPLFLGSSRCACSHLHPVLKSSLS